MISLTKATCLLLHHRRLGTYKFTAYDLRNFSLIKNRQGLFFSSRSSEVIYMALENLTVPESTALLREWTTREGVIHRSGT
jgi:hypothetical protein